ncbi:MAG: metallophosphoesterase family protein [Acidobacteriota bacterium]
MRYGVMADVHGNIWALDAVLADASNRGVDRWLNAGDCVYGPLDPASTARRLRGLDAVTVRGNQDRELLAPAEDADATRRFVDDALDTADRTWLYTLPTSAWSGAVFMCHGTPRSDVEPLLEHIGPHGVSLRDSETIRELLGDVEADSQLEVVVCGHTHVPNTVQLPGGRLVVNPGSVGLPAYTDETPHPHAMEAGSPHARYAILERSAAGWTVENRAVPYDWSTAAAVAESLGRSDWARRLVTGRA